MTPDELAGVIADAVATATAPLVARIAAMEQQRSLLPRDGRDGAMGPQGEKGLPGEPGLPGPQGPAGEKGLTGDRGERGPVGEPGAVGATGPSGPAGPQGERGADGVVTQALVMETLSAQPELLETAVARYLQQHPPSAGKDGAPGRDGVDGKDGKDGAPGRDGRDGASGLPGTPGEKGLNGKDGRDGIDGKDGRDGRDGVDGLGFDDFEEVLDLEGRSLVHRFTSGERVREFRHKGSWLLDRGIWDASKTYDAGDIVSRNGSGWIAQSQTKSMPGDGSSEWRLFVKHGRDGKPGPPGPQGLKGQDGKDGRPGKDLTQMDEKGRKW